MKTGAVACQRRLEAAMLRDVIILFSCASVGYAWLCAVVAPVVRAIRSIAHDATREAWAALALAIGALVLWFAVVAATIVLAMMLEPRAGLALLGSRLFWPGVALGAAVWTLQLAFMRRLPRFGDDFEAATAMAIVAVVDDEPTTLARAHQLYARHAIPLAL
jgi:hypothetical protein